MSYARIVRSHQRFVDELNELLMEIDPQQSKETSTAAVYTQEDASLDRWLQSTRTKANSLSHA